MVSNFTLLYKKKNNSKFFNNTFQIFLFTIGNITQPNSEPSEEKNPNIYIIDIRNYTWVNSFELTNSESIPTNTTKIIEPKSEQTSANNKKIIIASIGGSLGAVIIIVCGFLIYRWNKRSLVPGTTSDASCWDFCPVD